MTQNTNIRANKLVVKAIDSGHLQADFYRTHRHIATILDSETGFVAADGATKSAIREDFRKYVAENAETYGVTYDPTDRRTGQNIRKAIYKTEKDVREDVVAMVTPDIATFVSKMPHSDLVRGWVASVESMRPKAKTSKGSDLAMLGIEDGKYLSNGNLAWFDIEGTVTITTTSGAEIYQPITMELVSGQLKKFRMTQTQWNTDTTKSLIEAGLVEDKPKADKPKADKPKADKPKADKPKADKPKADKPKAERVGLGDEEHEGLHMDLTPEEETKAMAEAEAFLTKGKSKSKGKGKTPKASEAE